MSRTRLLAGLLAVGMAAGCKAQLASDYERWGKMVATIEGIMTTNRGGA